MDNDLTEFYNDGLAPSPLIETNARRLPNLIWRPTDSQVQAARIRAKKNLLILAAIIAVFALIFEWLLG